LGAAALLLWRRRSRQRRPAALTVDAQALITEPALPVSATRLADGRLRFYWAEARTQATLYAGEWTAVPGHAQPLATVRDSSELIVDDPFEGGRGCFTLAFENESGQGRLAPAAVRAVDLEGAGNFRDVGGLETGEGRIMRYGRVYRSGELSRLTAADGERLAAWPLRVIADLRSAREREEQPDHVPDAARYVSLPVYEKAPRGALLRTVLFQRERLGQVMAESYPRMLEEGATAYGELLRLLADEANLPLVFHCSAGKDRAGIAAALLQAVLGVPEETIIADYSLSNSNFESIQAELAQNEGLARLRISPEELQVVSVADPAWLRGLFRYVEERYGDVRSYLLGPAGLDEQTLGKLAELLLVPQGV